MPASHKRVFVTLSEAGEKRINQIQPRNPSESNRVSRVFDAACELYDVMALDASRETVIEVRNRLFALVKPHPLNFFGDD